MELIGKTVRTPDIDEFKTMRDVALSVCDAYNSLDFASLIGMFAHDVDYVSHLANFKVEGVEAVAAHFRKKQLDLRQANDIVFAIPAKLRVDNVTRDLVPEEERAHFQYHHGEPVVVLGYYHHPSYKRALMRFTLDQTGHIQSMVLYHNFHFRTEIVPEYELNPYIEYQEKSIRWIAQELIAKGHELHEIHDHDIPNLVTFKDDKLYFTIVEAVPFPYEPIFSQERIDFYREHCVRHQAIGLLAKVLLRMDNDHPWDIRFNQELKMDYVIDGFVPDEAAMNWQAN